MDKKLIIYTDGGARGNPGPAGAGVVFMNEKGEVLNCFKKYLGKATNNIAEYSAVVLALEEAKKRGVEEIDFFLDSELIVKQMKGEYKVKNPELGKLFIKVYNLKHSFKNVSFNHIVREKNKLADKLVNEVIDARQ
ncbi:MAG: ribonuclease HI family protein [Candidatus Kuenenbacteria bacterium]